MRRLIIIAGPTAVGKTGIALALAHKLPAEIINGDMGQLYRPLTIGTAKPDVAQQDVPHHLFDVLDAPVDCTVTQWREWVIEKVEEIQGRNRTPILVGGSGFYLKSLFFPPEADSGTSDVATAQDDQSLWKKLESIDSERARQLHPNDIYRIQRALAIWERTGKLPSTIKPTFKPIFPFSCFILMREREELYRAIDQRTVEMSRNGWVDEVRALEDTEWEPFLRKKKIIGYDAILDFLREGGAQEQLIEHIQRKTRNYAKRQITFFRSFSEQMQQALEEAGFDGSCRVVQCTGRSEREIVDELRLPTR